MGKETQHADGPLCHLPTSGATMVFTSQEFLWLWLIDCLSCNQEGWSYPAYWTVSSPPQAAISGTVVSWKHLQAHPEQDETNLGRGKGLGKALFSSMTRREGNTIT